MNQEDATHHNEVPGRPEEFKWFDVSIEKLMPIKNFEISKISHESDEATSVQLTKLSVPTALHTDIFACQTEDNWDDEDAIGITVKACEAAVYFLQALIDQDAGIAMPKVSPSVFGSITLYWSCEDKHLLVRPSPDLDLAYYQEEQSGHGSIYGDEAQTQAINRVIRFLDATHAEQN